MVSNQQFRLKWNNHRNTVLQEFETLLHNNSFVDCTIGADGKYLKAHKIVLSACSPYLQNVFSEHFDKHPVILLKDVSFKELKCMIDYMYCGEVNISECELPSFLRTAQSLKIKGLAEDINEYDSASDNEQQEISSLTENGRTVEPNVEIHDDEGPPAKKSAPSLIYSNFAGRKRKSPNNAVSSATKSSNSNEKVPPSAPLTSKLTGGNVPSCPDTENSDNNVCTTSKENNNLHKEEPDDEKKIISRDVHPENVKNKAEVKEEPVDADDDNSSYEFGNNPCEDSDPLNEDSESNCATSGKNFNEVSIASVSSCNEGEANDDDDMLEIKEEIITEATNSFAAQQQEDEEHKIRVRSTNELISSSSALYVVREKEDCDNNEIIVNVSSIDEDTFANITTEEDGAIEANDSNTEVIEVKILPEDDFTDEEEVTRVLPRRAARMAKRTISTDRNRRKNLPIQSKDRSTPAETSTQRLRKILPAPMKPTTVLPSATSLLPIPMNSDSPGTVRTPKKPSPAVPTRSATLPRTSYRVIRTATNAADKSPQTILTPVKGNGQITNTGSANTNNSTAIAELNSTDKTSSVNSQPFFLINPTTRVMLLNSDLQSSTPLYTIPRLPTAVTVTASGTTSGGQVRKFSYIQASADSPKSQKSVRPDLPAVVNPGGTAACSPVSMTKFRKIAPLVKDPNGAVQKSIFCKHCFEAFVEEKEWKKHAQLCIAKNVGCVRRRRKRNDDS